MSKKASKAEAQYRDRPKGDERCDRCSMWRAPNKCTAVAGEISARGWCKYYRGKEEANTPMRSALDVARGYAKMWRGDTLK